jgi:hypothetical protein
VAFNGLTLLSAPDGALLLQLHRRVTLRLEPSFGICGKR